MNQYDAYVWLAKHAGAQEPQGSVGSGTSESSAENRPHPASSACEHEWSRPKGFSTQKCNKCGLITPRETPRTDALIAYLEHESGCKAEGNDLVVIEFLREMELEINDMRAELVDLYRERAAKREGA